MDISIEKMIKKYGEKQYKGNRIASATVYCFRCKKAIRSNNKEDVEGTEFILTKRGTPIFLHKECAEKVFLGEQ